MTERVSTTTWAARLASTAAGASSQRELLELSLAHAQRLLHAPIGLLLLEQDEIVVRSGVRALHYDAFVRHWRNHDATLRSALALSAAVRDEDVPERAGVAAFRAGFSERVGAEAYLVAPLYGPSGAAAGTLHLWRKRGEATFTSADRVLATAFVAVLSMILARRSRATPALQKLAPREHQVARLAATGRTNRAIASELGVAPETVKQTLRRVYRKVSVGSRTELAAHYGRRGLL